MTTRSSPPTNSTNSKPLFRVADVLSGHYVETSLSRAAFLLARGIELVELRSTERAGQVAFVFTNKGNQARDAIRDYNNNGEVRILDYTVGIDELKRLLFEEIKEIRDQRDGNGNR
jgi:Domain of unknown function (DUF5659)